MRLLLTVLFITIMTSNLLGQNKYLDKEGYISFFSKAPVEDIEAYNNQVFSLIDIDSGEINVQLLVKSFLFEKALMREHFNESYIESDIYPTASFEGELLDFDPDVQTLQTKMIKGIFEYYEYLQKMKNIVRCHNQKMFVLLLEKKYLALS